MFTNTGPETMPPQQEQMPPMLMQGMFQGGRQQNFPQRFNPLFHPDNRFQSMVAPGGPMGNLFGGDGGILGGLGAGPNGMFGPNGIRGFLNKVSTMPKETVQSPIFKRLFDQPKDGPVSPQGFGGFLSRFMDGNNG